MKTDRTHSSKRTTLLRKSLGLLIRHTHAGVSVLALCKRAVEWNADRLRTAAPADPPRATGARRKDQKRKRDGCPTNSERVTLGMRALLRLSGRRPIDATVCNEFPDLPLHVVGVLQ